MLGLNKDFIIFPYVVSELSIDLCHKRKLLKCHYASFTAFDFSKKTTTPSRKDGWLVVHS